MKSERRLQGLGAAPGVVLGDLLVYQDEAEVSHQAAGTVDQERSRFAAAVLTVTGDLDRLVATADPEARAIVEAHRLMLTDPALQSQVEDRIMAGQPASQAVEATVAEFAAQLESLDDAYLRERAADVRDVGRRLLAAMTGKSVGLRLERPSIVVARDLAPTDTIGVDRKLLLGLVTEQGGMTSHTCILARNWGVPAVVGVGGLLDEVETGAMVALDGSSGTLVLRPSAATIAAYQQAMDAERARRRAEAADAALPAETPDGKRIEIAANAGSPADVIAAREWGAQGVGLLRTEFLFMGRESAPDEEEQYQAYRSALEAANGERVVIRTLDIGGDKDVPYLGLPKEQNPFLGCRALRLCFGRPGMFQIQLRALLRAACHGRLAVMFPMVGGLEDLQQAKAALAEAADSLTNEQTPWQMPEVGIMIEIPSAALIADRLAPEVDFFSVGTNDLTQYTLAVDRGNPELVPLYQPYHPAVLILIDRVIRAAHAAGKWVGVCGEMGGQPLGALALLGLGIDELSAAPPMLPTLRRLIRRIKYQEAEAVVRKALEKSTAEAVIALLQGLAEEI